MTQLSEPMIRIEGNGAADAGTPPITMPGTQAHEAPQMSPEVAARIDEQIAKEAEENERRDHRLHELNVQMMELRETEDDIREQEGIIAELKGQLAAAKEELKLRIGAMRAIVRRRERQRNLFNEPQPEADTEEEAAVASAAEPTGERTTADDPALMPIEELHAPDGYTEKMREAGITTIGELEKRIGAGDFLPKSIKGIGQAAVDKVTDCLMRFRQDHPVATAVGARLTPQDEAEIDELAKGIANDPEVPSDSTFNWTDPNGKEHTASDEPSGSLLQQASPESDEIVE